MDNLTIDFEGLKKDHWSEAELGNARLLADFVQALMNDHNFDDVLTTFGNDSYLQHNRNIPEGMEALVAFVADFVKRFPDYGYDVKRILVDDDHVTFHSHVTIKKEHRGNDSKGLNIIDTWRVENGQIVEHWDAIQSLDGFMRFYALLTGGKVRNSNGVF